jgi:predicted nuclease with TOPRIM domain
MWMGHAFALDSAYLRMSDEELEDEYVKAVDRFTFLGQSNGALKTKVEQLEEENKELRARLDRLEAISVERLVLAAAQKSPRSHKRSK